MPKYKIFAEEARSYEVEIEADSLEEAMDALEADPCKYISDDDSGDYIDDSFHVNRECTIGANDDEDAS